MLSCFKDGGVFSCEEEPLTDGKGFMESLFSRGARNGALAAPLNHVAFSAGEKARQFCSSLLCRAHEQPHCGWYVGDWHPGEDPGLRALEEGMDGQDIRP
ncbi:hypothetical protein CSOJ01_12278 [Colletotrichum sojae]|uniref:Uncharacterized protein n=1 Tax=Colletotrichum sojae TaxID=2175907 RepID=A0A8H6MM03_9PEZI|nr:hypothetical protein CSOJ01_12278 [Colletotrichum sojae]